MNQNIKVYDFKKPQRYSTDNMRFLSVIVEDFCKNINLYLAFELKRPNIVCKLERIEQTNYDEFINMIANDSVIIEHSIQPLVQDLIYQLDKGVVLSFVDLMLGGNGVFDDYKRELTEIDRELMMHMASSFLTKLHIVDGCEYREVSRVHSNVGESKKYPISESVLIAHIKMMYGNKEVGKMRFCNPYSCMEPVLGQLETKNLFKDKDIENEPEFKKAMYDNVCGVKVEMAASLGESNISVSELLNIKLGDVITLDTKLNEEVKLSVSNSKSFICKPGVIHDKKGLIIVDSIKKEV